MPGINSKRSRGAAFIAAAFAAGLALAPIAGSLPAWADAGHGKDGHKGAMAKGAKAKIVKAKSSAGNGQHKPVDIRLYFPRMDSAMGMRLFASKGCVTCHSINGVGGHNSARLDAHSMKPFMNPFEFVAKMWRMAPAMIAAQEEALGEQILFSGDEIAHIIGFLHDDSQQHKFKASMIPPKVLKLMGHKHGAKPPHAKEIGHDKKKTGM